MTNRTTRGLPPCWEHAIIGFTLWLRVAGKRDATITLRRDHLRCIARRSGTTHPRQVTLNMLVMLCSERDWSREHRKGMRSSLVGFYQWALLQGLVECNPALGLPAVLVPVPAPRPTPDEIWASLLAAAPSRERLMARLAAEAGLRRAEVAACHSTDLLHTADGWALLVHGKGGRQRVVALTDDLAAELRRALTRCGFVFPGAVDGHLSPAWVGTVISRLMPAGWSMHTLRHRFASRGYAGTRNLRAVQEALGHASVATTQRYTAVSSLEVRSVSEAAR